MRPFRGAHRVYRNGHRAISSVLEACIKEMSVTAKLEFNIRTNGERDTRGQLSVQLRLGRSGTNRAPAEQILEARQDVQLRRLSDSHEIASTTDREELRRNGI